MATLNTRDPVQGLIDYVGDVKPYHTKILEVWVEYIYGDEIDATIKDEMKMVVNILFDRTRKYCDYGWDMTAWGKMLADLNMDEIVPGVITYAPNSTVKKSIAYQLYFDYLCDMWRWNNGEGLQPVISSNPTSKYYLLSFDVVISAARQYFVDINNGFQYWYEPASRKVYKRVGYEWHEQSAYVSSIAPLDPMDMDIWVNTQYMKLFLYMSGSWEETTNFYVAYKAPKAPPRYPPEWNSVWDRPECTVPWGENWVYAYVTDELQFEYGTELFLYESVRTMVFDPTGDPQSTSGGLGRTEYPIKYKTTITQDPDGRYNISRQEVSIITDPTNPEIISHPYAISLDGYEFEGFGLDRHRKGVRLTEFLVWKFKDQTTGMQLIADNVINRDTFGFSVQNQHLVAQSIASTGRTDIDCPFDDGQIVYFTSSDDLPTYELLSQDYRRAIPLRRYCPYKIKKINAREFSVALLRVKPQYDPVSGNRINPAHSYEIDTELMGSSPYLTFTTSGNGVQHFGIGHPIPFIESHHNAKDEQANGTFDELIYSPGEAFTGYKHIPIMNALVNFNDNGVKRNAFVITGDHTDIEPGESINVVGSADSKNDGSWTATTPTLWTNVELDKDGTPVRDANNLMIQLPAPKWWNELLMGDWPQADLSGTTYFAVTTVGVDGVAPSTQFPFGNIAFSYYNFGEPSASQNTAQAKVTDEIKFQLSDPEPKTD